MQVRIDNQKQRYKLQINIIQSTKVILLDHRMSQKHDQLDSHVFDVKQKDLNQKDHNFHDEEIYPQSTQDMTCWQKFKNALNNFVNRTIDYFQYDRVFNAEGEPTIELKKCYKRFLQNYDQTYSEREIRFAFSFDYVLQEKIKEEERKQKNFWTEFYRFICCEGGNEMEQIDEAYKSQREYQKIVRKRLLEKREEFEEMMKKEAQEKQKEKEKEKQKLENHEKLQEIINNDSLQFYDEDQENKSVHKSKKTTTITNINTKILKINQTEQNILSSEFIEDEQSNRTHKKGTFTPANPNKKSTNQNIFNNEYEANRQQIGNTHTNNKYAKSFNTNSDPHIIKNSSNKQLTNTSSQQNITQNIYHENHIYNEVQHVNNDAKKKKKNRMGEEFDDFNDFQEDQQVPKRKKRQNNTQNDPFNDDDTLQNTNNNSFNNQFFNQTRKNSPSRSRNNQIQYTNTNINSQNTQQQQQFQEYFYNKDVNLRNSKEKSERVKDDVQKSPNRNQNLAQNISITSYSQQNNELQFLEQDLNKNSNPSNNSTQLNLSSPHKLTTQVNQSNNGSAQLNQSNTTQNITMGKSNQGRNAINEDDNASYPQSQLNLQNQQINNNKSNPNNLYGYRGNNAQNSSNNVQDSNNFNNLNYRSNYNPNDIQNTNSFNNNNGLSKNADRASLPNNTSQLNKQGKNKQKVDRNGRSTEQIEFNQANPQGRNKQKQGAKSNQRANFDFDYEFDDQKQHPTPNSQALAQAKRKGSPSKNQNYTQSIDIRDDSSSPSQNQNTLLKSPKINNDNTQLFFEQDEEAPNLTSNKQNKKRRNKEAPQAKEDNEDFDLGNEEQADYSNPLDEGNRASPQQSFENMRSKKQKRVKNVKKDPEDDAFEINFQDDQANEQENAPAEQARKKKKAKKIIQNPDNLQDEIALDDFGAFNTQVNINDRQGPNTIGVSGEGESILQASKKRRNKKQLRPKEDELNIEEVVFDTHVGDIVEEPMGETNFVKAEKKKKRVKQRRQEEENNDEEVIQINF